MCAEGSSSRPRVQPGPYLSLALADTPPLRLSVVCRATCRERDFRVLCGGVGYSRPRAAAYPPRPTRGASIR